MLAICLTVLILAAPLVSQAAPTLTDRGASALDDDRPMVQARLVFDRQNTQPGQVFRVGVLLSIEPGWHVYWLNPGFSGFPTEVQWSSTQATFGPTRYPAPTTFYEADGVNVQTLHYYERQGLIAAPGRSAAGYREYRPTSIGRIRAIKRAQRLGFTLKEIKELTGLSDEERVSEELRVLVGDKLAEIDDKIASLRKMRRR